MSATTSIEWTDATVNPIRARNKATGAVGHFCEKVSPGCAHCYASVWNERVRPIAGKDRGHLIGTGLTFDVRHRDQIEFFLDDSKLQQVLAWKAPRRIFWCDMTDMFGEWVPEAWLDQMFAVMALTPQHTHQVLTKRPERLREYVSRQNGHSTGVWFAAEKLKPSPPPRTWIHAARTFSWPLPNVWLGVSVEDQQRADERIPLLLRTPAAVRFLSCEPLLGETDLSNFLWTIPGARLHSLHWVIVGGESGPGARPLNVRWVRDIVEQCQSASVPVFVKQLGARVIDRNDAGFLGEGPDHWPDVIDQEDRIEYDLDGTRDGYQGAPVRIHLKNRKGNDPAEWPEDLRVREFPR